MASKDIGFLLQSCLHVPREIPRDLPVTDPSYGVISLIWLESNDKLCWNSTEWPISLLGSRPCCDAQLHVKFRFLAFWICIILASETDINFHKALHI